VLVTGAWQEETAHATTRSEMGTQLEELRKREQLLREEVEAANSRTAALQGQLAPLNTQRAEIVSLTEANAKMTEQCRALESEVTTAVAMQEDIRKALEAERDMRAKLESCLTIKDNQLGAVADMNTKLQHELRWSTRGETPTRIAHHLDPLPRHYPSAPMHNVRPTASYLDEHHVRAAPATSALLAGGSRVADGAMLTKPKEREVLMNEIEGLIASLQTR